VKRKTLFHFTGVCNPRNFKEYLELFSLAASLFNKWRGFYKNRLKKTAAKRHVFCSECGGIFGFLGGLGATKGA
jgi:hypothetical protein